MDNWQKIETAPKDATWIMLGMVGRNEILLGFWHSLMNAWWGQGGSEGEWKKWERATHWQPLPNPPK